MHTYTISNDIRKKVTVTIFVISMLISLILNLLLGNILNQLIAYLKTMDELNTCIEFVEFLKIDLNFFGVPVLYGLFTGLYEKYIWKCAFMKKIHNVPDLNGEWEGYLQSSFNYKEKIPMKMKIKQTWDKISFKSIFPKSVSYSNVAAINVDGPYGIEISFGFKNDSYCMEDNMPTYYGYNILKLEANNKIKARYCNDRNNHNIGYNGGNKGIFELEKK